MRVFGLNGCIAHLSKYSSIELEELSEKARRFRLCWQSLREVVIWSWVREGYVEGLIQRAGVSRGSSSVESGVSWRG